MAVSIESYLAQQAAANAAAAANSSSLTGGSSSTSGTAADIQSGQTNLNTSYQDFLTLLTTQLKNQDPSSPLDPNQFTQQIVEMTGVQQQLLSNQLLQQLVNDQPGSSVSDAVGLIGKTVTATSSTASLQNGQASWTYNLPTAASNATVTVTDSSGNVVYTGTAPSFAAGANTFTWNGQNSSGVQLANGGTYTLSVAASDLNGVAETPTVSVTGAVSSVQQVNGQTVVGIGAAQAPLSSVTGVSD